MPTKTELREKTQLLLKEATNAGRAYWRAVDAGNNEAAAVLKIEWERVSAERRAAAAQLAELYKNE